MPRKKTNEPMIDTDDGEPSQGTGGNLPDTIERQRADIHIRDVSRYKLPPDLETRLAIYADEDPVFCEHIRRAHKYYNTLPEARGQEPWKLEVKLFDYDEGSFNKFGPTRRETVPTPQELRDENAYGKLRFVLHYWTPYKTVKGNITRPGIMTLKSKSFEIAPPVSAAGPMPIRPHAQVQPPAQTINLPPPQTVDAYQQIFQKINEMTLQAFNMQMSTMANRQSIVDEGIEKGKLMQLVEIQNRQIAELTKTIQAIQSSGDDDDGRDYSGPPASVQNPQMGGMSPVIGVLLEKGLPVLLEKLGLNGTTAAVASEVVKGAASAPPNAENGGEGQ